MSPNPDQAAAALRIDAPAVAARLTEFITAQTRAAGFERLTLGLSGGLDSAVAYYLAVAALGPAAVYPLLLPYRQSSPDSLTDALACVEALGGGHTIADISPQVDAYFDAPTTPPAADRDADLLRRGNKMARERMAILFDHSAAQRALVMGTSNKAELLLGYGTLHGDLACAFNPLADLYKTQVRALAAHLQLPQALLDKPPSADLFPGQTDEAQLGWSYPELDAALHCLVDEQQPPEAVAAAGHDPALVEHVVRLMRAYRFKRRLPTYARADGQPLDFDRDWGW